MPLPPIVIPTTSLYPLILFDVQIAAQAPNIVPAGNVGLIALDMFDVNQMQILLIQTMGEQDYSLRAWVSQYAFGQSVLELLPDNTFPLVRFMPRPLYLFTATQQPPAGEVLLAPVQNQRYFLNVQNVTNQTCAFAFSQTIIA